MSANALYERAEALRTHLLRTAMLLHVAEKHNDAKMVAKFGVERQHTEQRLRHLNHHILRTEA